MSVRIQKSSLKFALLDAAARLKRTFGMILVAAAGFGLFAVAGTSDYRDQLRMHGVPMEAFSLWTQIFLILTAIMVGLIGFRFLKVRRRY